MDFLTQVDWKLAYAVWLRNFTVYQHTWKLSLLPRFFEPVFYLLAMGLGLGRFVGNTIDGQDYLYYVGPGLLAASAMNGASFETTYTMFVRRSHKIYDAYLTTPLAAQDLIAGELLWAITRSMLYGFVFFLVLVGFTLFGRPIVTSFWGALFILDGLFLIGFVFAAMGTLVNAVIPIIDLFAAYFTLVLTPLFLFSGIFFPLDTIPYGETIAWFTPLYHGVRLMRGLLQGPFGVDQWVSVGWLLVVGIVVWAVAFNKMQRRLID